MVPGPGVTADRLPSLRGDLLVVQSGQLDQPQDRLRVVAEPGKRRLARPDLRRADVKAAVQPPAEDRVQDSPALACAGLFREPRYHVTDLRSVAEIIPHELLHGEHSRHGPIAAEFGDAELLRPVQHVRRFPGVEMELVPQPKQILGGVADNLLITRREDSQVVESRGLGRCVAGHADPAEQLEIAKSAPRALHVRLQQVHRFAEADAFFPPGAVEVRHERAGTAAHLAAEALQELVEEFDAPRQVPRLHQRAADRGVPAGQPTCLVDRADAVPEHQPRIEHVAQQALRQTR